MSERRRFDGKVVIVTGAASGIGRATALAFAAEGACVAALDREPVGLADTCARIRASDGQAHAFEVDLLEADAIATCVARITAELGAPRVLANVAGLIDTAQGEGLDQVDLARWNRVLAVNLTAPFLLARAVLPGMVAAGGGAIVNVSSVAGRWKSTNCTAAYTASKAGLLGLTRHLAADYGGLGVRVNAICPSGVDTPGFHDGDAGNALDAAERDRRRAKSEAYGYLMPIKRVSTPDEQAAAILFLASDDASYVNGASLDVNGGMYMA